MKTKVKTEFEIPDDALSDELKALIEQTPVITQERERELGDAIRSLRADPTFQAEVLKAQVVEHMLQGMEREGLNKNQLAKKWGKSRQYVGRALNEDKRVNFTLETVCEMLSLVGKRLRVVVEDINTTAKPELRQKASAELEVASMTLQSEEEPATTEREFWIQNTPRKRSINVPSNPKLKLAANDEW